MQYPVNEIFETIQGEAVFTGTPAIFVRLQGCPVGCAWCDTKHTWTTAPEHAVPAKLMLAKVSDTPAYTQMTVDDLLATLQTYAARHVVVTGGEPCLYDLVPLTSALLDCGYGVQIETSGTHDVRADNRAWVTVSPKLDMPGGFAVLDAAIQRANEIKYPVGKTIDVENLRARVLPLIKAGVLVWLQPLSQSKSATTLCVEAATKNGFRVSIQTHKFIGLR